MLPTPVRKIIEAYGMDMAMHEEMQKIIVSDWLIRRADAYFLSQVMYHTMQQGSLNTDQLVQILVKSAPKWDKTTAGWCLNRIREMYYERHMLWVDLGFEMYLGSRPLIGTFLKKSKFLDFQLQFCEELWDYKERKDDYLIGPDE